MPPRLAVTLGDPNGIGPETVLKAAREVAGEARLVAVGSAAVLRETADRLGLGPVAPVQTFDEGAPGGALAVLDPAPDAPPPLRPGATTAEGGEAAMRAVALGCDLCLAGAADGLVTAPLSKEAIALAGYAFPGHTEFLQERTGAEDVVMVLAANLPAGPLRVALVTIHVPVRAVTDLVTADRVGRTVRTLDAALRRGLGVARPRMAVLGLNPHAGDGGVIGREDVDVVGPAVGALRAEGLDVEGPFPADAFFGRARWADVDAVVAMYHDQGLAPFKALAQGAGVNVTLGLPIVRTSPDHGTAFPIAGQGVADPSSTVAAIRLAVEMAERRRAGTSGKGSGRRP